MKVNEGTRLSRKFFSLQLIQSFEVDSKTAIETKQSKACLVCEGGRGFETQQASDWLAMRR